MFRAASENFHYKFAVPFPCNSMAVMQTTNPRDLPSVSELQKLLDSNPAPTASPDASHLHYLALKVAHNLQYQHLWTDVRLHTESTLADRALLRPLVSGLPPQRLYIHPDEQIELLQQQKNQGKTGLPELQREREWVLPSHLREKWSLKRFGQVFDDIEAVPSHTNGLALFAPQQAEKTEGMPSDWRANLPKRLLLATLDDDSTVVYYIVHDGIVKPRQN